MTVVVVVGCRWTFNSSVNVKTFVYASYIFRSRQPITVFLGFGIGNRNYIGVIYVVYIATVPEYQ